MNLPLRILGVAWVVGLMAALAGVIYSWPQIELPEIPPAPETPPAPNEPSVVEICDERVRLELEIYKLKIEIAKAEAQFEEKLWNLSDEQLLQLLDDLEGDRKKNTE